MKKYMVYYYVVGDTLTEGEEPKIFPIAVPDTIPHFERLGEAVRLAKKALKMLRPMDDNIFVRVEQDKYQFA